jgi:hypothetical protein
MPRHLPAAALLLMLFCPAPALAQADTPPGPPVAFAPVTAVPIPLASTSGRFNSLNPRDQSLCRNSDVTGRVVSTRLIQLNNFVCKNYGLYDGCCDLVNVLMNVRFSDPGDTPKMVVGTNVTIQGIFKSAREPHGGYLVFFLIAENAKILSRDPPDRSATLAGPTTSFIRCQPPELDALASQLGRELCVQSTIMANLTVAGPALETAARAPSLDSPGGAASGDPSVITCRLDPERTDAHLSAMACARNNYWAWWSIKHRLGQRLPTPAPP